MEVLGTYRNGNYDVTIYSDGTKIRQSASDKPFKPEFPESIDLKITNRCDMGCPYCHEDSNLYGEHADILNPSVIDTLHPFTELAIGGGNPLTHPDLVQFLEMCKVKQLIPSITLHQYHFMQNYGFVESLIDQNLLYGIGVSYNHYDRDFIQKMQDIPSAVIHVIAGVVTPEQLFQLSNQGLNLLILGYKRFRRGSIFFNEHDESVNSKIQFIKKNLNSLCQNFNHVAFDNLALRQLDVQSQLSPEEWKEQYMGADGQFTMYIDMVEKEYAVSSTSISRHSLVPNIRDIFKEVQEE